MLAVLAAGSYAVTDYKNQRLRFDMESSIQIPKLSPLLTRQTTMALFFYLLLSISITSTSTAASLVSSLIEELNRPPPPNFTTTISTNCHNNPSLPYCNSSDVVGVFKSMIVERHLCTESRNPNCPDGFEKIDLRDRPLVAPLYLSFSFFWKYCPLTIVAIDLSNNSLKGTFPVDIFQCSRIQFLNLRCNELTGDFPVDGLLRLGNLKSLNLSYNRFLERSDAELRALIGRFNSSSFIYSGILPEEHDHGMSVTTTVLLLLAVFGFVVSTVGFLGWLFLRRPDFLPSRLRSSHKFTYAMLKAATDGFSPRNLVWKNEKEEYYYKGVTRSGTEVGVKIDRIRVPLKSGREFDELCEVLLELDHKNLAKVLGWCKCRTLTAVVVHEPKGAESIEKWLCRLPSWKRRIKVMRGVLEGMSYLQQQCPQIGHDVKANNVIFGEDQEPLISSFRITEEHRSEAKGTYKFGMFVLQMVAGKRWHNKPKRDEAGFVEWVRLQYPNNLQAVVDEGMKMKGCSYEELKIVLSIGLTCTDFTAKHVPSISQISIMFKQIPVCPNYSCT